MISWPSFLPSWVIHSFILASFLSPSLTGSEQGCSRECSVPWVWWYACTRVIHMHSTKSWYFIYRLFIFFFSSQLISRVWRRVGHQSLFLLWTQWLWRHIIHSSWRLFQSSPGGGRRSGCQPGPAEGLAEGRSAGRGKQRSLLCCRCRGWRRMATLLA